MTRQLDIFANKTASATTPQDSESGTVGSASAGDPRGHEVNQGTAPTRPTQLIRWPTWAQYKTDYDVDRPPFGVAEGWDHMVHVVRQRDALRRKERP